MKTLRESALRAWVVTCLSFGAGCAGTPGGDEPDSVERVTSAGTAAGPARIAMLDVGQGDALVVVAPSGCAALIDGGPTGSGATIKAYLKSIGIASIDFAILSHYHADHVGGLDEVEQGEDGVRIGTVYDHGGSYSTIAFNDYATQYAGRRATATLGQTISLCSEVRFEVVSVNANGLTTSDENARSVGVKISFGELDVVSAGDLTGSTTDVESLVGARAGEVEIYKVDHHGSRYSSNEAFLDLLRPQVSLISVGWNNTYQHPTPEALARLAAVGSAVWQTEDPSTATKRGHIEVTSIDGKSWLVSQGERIERFVSKGVDLLPPSAPAGLTATVVGSSRVDLAWTSSTDDVAVAGYRVRRDGAVVTTTGTAAWSDSVAPGGTHTWSVTAFDVAGNESAASEAATATTLLDPPSSLAARAISSTRIDLTWTPPADPRGMSFYGVYRDGALVATTGDPLWLDSSLAPSQTATYRVSSIADDGRESPPSNAATATTPCTARVVGKSWSSTRFEITVRATCSLQPTAEMVAYAGSTELGLMSWKPDKGYYQIIKKLPSKPACVSVSSSCGAKAESCY